MLIIAENLHQLDFSQLMQVYREGNEENGADLYPQESKERQLLLAEQDFYRYLQDCFFKTADAVYCVLEEGGRYLAALRLEPYRDGMLLEALETKPEIRRNGCAVRLIGEVTAKVPGKIYSHISRRNTASIRTHEKCGFQKILDHAVYVDGSVSTRADTYCR